MNGVDFNDNLLKIDDDEEEIPRALEKFAARKGTKRPMYEMDLSDSDDSDSSSRSDDQPDLGDYYADLIDECFEAYFISLGTLHAQWMTDTLTKYKFRFD